MKLMLVSLVVGSVLAACSGMEPAPAKVPTAKIFKSFGTVQCEPASVSTGPMVAELEKAGVHVYASACGVDGMMRPAVCGAGDGRIAIIDVAADKISKAMSLGFDPISKVPEFQTAPCK